MNPAMPPCPRCGQSDAVQPISSIFAAAAATATGLAVASPVAPTVAHELFPPPVSPVPQKTDFPVSQYRQASAATKNSGWRWVDTGLFALWLVLVAVVLFKIGDEDISNILVIPI